MAETKNYDATPEGLKAFASAFNSTYTAVGIVQYWRNQAEQGLKGGCDARFIPYLEDAIAKSDIALSAIESGNMDRFAWALETMLRHCATSKIFDVNAAVGKFHGDNSPRRTGKQSPLTQVVCKIAEEIRSFEPKRIAEYWARQSSQDDAESADFTSVIYEHSLWADGNGGALSRLTYHYGDDEIDSINKSTATYGAISNAAKRHAQTK